MPTLPEERVAWFDVLTKRLAGFTRPSSDKTRFADPRERALIVARGRWILLFLITIYAFCAGAFFYFSRFGFFLSFSQLFFLCASLLAVLSYNAVYHYYYDRIRHLRGVDSMQVLLDLVFVTVIVHFSGGAASWFWPVYLLVTVEAAFLLEEETSVWLAGGFGAVVFGTLLLFEYFGWLPHITMPFALSSLPFDYLFLALVWLWVAILNTAVAVILTFLMSVIRSETSLLRQSEERLVEFIEKANDLIYSCTPDGILFYANESWREVLGYDAREMAGLQLWDLVPTLNRQTFMEEFRHLLTGGSGNLLQTMFLTSAGREVMLEGHLTLSHQNGLPVAVWGSFRDVTERTLAQKQLYHLAHYDILTGLPNRALLYDRLQHARAYAKRSRLRMAILFLDLDRFKVINDTLGHPVGDKLLVSVAQRLGECCREVDTVARIGGDEFLVVLEGLRDVLHAEVFAKKVIARLAEPHLIGPHELFVTGSVGISVYPDDDVDLDNLIKKADIAMYAAKSLGNNGFKFYDMSMDENSHRRFVLENSMRKSLEHQDFRLVYQPKLNIMTDEITAVEALLRWDHPELGMISPVDFIPVAEETGLIVPLGEWVMRQACLQNKQWQEEGLFMLRVAVNLSGYQLQQPNFVEVVKKVLSQTGLDPKYLELEITETVVMQNPDFTVLLLDELCDMGIHISIDDFGTGYSSLSHLKRFSVNTLKMDKSFVRDVVENGTDAAIAKAIISMGQSLNLKVIAEGVETEGQLAFLKETNCDEVQGFLFSKPVSAPEVVAFVADWARRGAADPEPVPEDAPEEESERVPPGERIPVESLA